jgi:hypothetical protein
LLCFIFKVLYFLFVFFTPPPPPPPPRVVVAAANSESVGFCHRPLLATYLILTQF